MTIRKKLIEVSIPLEAINAASAREKSIRHGHPSTLHLWWARRPLAACRAVLFAQLVDDPSAWPGRYPFPEIANDEEAERKRLHRDHRTDGAVGGLEQRGDPERGALGDCALGGLGAGRGAAVARATGAAILDYLQTKAPPVYDPFSGGGSIPLEAQRLGLRAYGSDLNPVAVLIGKALVEIPPKFAGRPPVNPKARTEARHGALRRWKGAQGLAEDVRYYGQWMRDEAERRIGHLYPKATLPDGSRGDGDRLAVGAHGALARPGGEGRDGAAGLIVPALDQGGQKSLGRAGDRSGAPDGWRFEVRTRGAVEGG